MKNINDYKFSKDGQRAICKGFTMWEVCTIEYAQTSNGMTDIYFIKHHGKNTKERVEQWLEDGQEIELFS
jgi:hypothetical protein